MKKCESCEHEYGPDGPRHHPDCRYWIDSKEYQYCTFVAIEKRGSMTLREVAELLGISHVGVKLIEERAIRKIYKKAQNNKKFDINLDLLRD